MKKNRILLAHPGFSMQRHFNNYEAFVNLAMHCFGAECEAIVCGKMLKACGFRGGDENSLPEDFYCAKEAHNLEPDRIRFRAD